MANLKFVGTRDEIVSTIVSTRNIIASLAGYGISNSSKSERYVLFILSVEPPKKTPSFL